LSKTRIRIKSKAKPQHFQTLKILFCDLLSNKFTADRSSGAMALASSRRRAGCQATDDRVSLATSADGRTACRQNAGNAGNATQLARSTSLDDDNNVPLLR